MHSSLSDGYGNSSFRCFFFLRFWNERILMISMFFFSHFRPLFGKSSYVPHFFMPRNVVRSVCCAPTFLFEFSQRGTSRHVAFGLRRVFRLVHHLPQQQLSAFFIRRSRIVYPFGKLNISFCAYYQ